MITLTALEKISFKELGLEEPKDAKSSKDAEGDEDAAINTEFVMKCNRGHPLAPAFTRAEVRYGGDAYCDQCGTRIPLDRLPARGFMRCARCQYDLCNKCSDKRLYAKKVERISDAFKRLEKLFAVDKSISVKRFHAYYRNLASNFPCIWLQTFQEQSFSKTWLQRGDPSQEF